MIILPGIELPDTAIAHICRIHQVRDLSLFGRGLLGVAAMTRELSTLLGRRVGLAVKPALKPLIRNGVLADARLINAA